LNRWALLPVCAALILAASSRGDGADRVTIHLKWLHGAQFAGLYAAEVNGIFAREGLEVEFIDGPATEEVLVALSEGVYDFVVADPSRHLSLTSRGIPNVAVAAVFQIDPVVIFALPESGIRRAEDLVGKRVMSFPTSYVVPAVLGRVGLSVADVELGPPSFDLSDLYSGAYDAWSGYYANEVLQARADGHDVNVIYPTDYGVHLYGDVLIVRQDLVETKPDLVQRVVSSLIEGWMWAFDHVEEAAGLALAWDPSLDLEKQREMLAACLPFIHVGEVHLGEMTSERWADMAAAMAASGLLPEDLDVAIAYTLDFVRALYPPGP
jgi:ABC-type nitrate/sulfonate/bicarbonate transport system substrate-binding protein